MAELVEKHTPLEAKKRYKVVEAYSNEIENVLNEHPDYYLDRAIANDPGLLLILKLNDRPYNVGPKQFDTHVGDMTDVSV